MLIVSTFKIEEVVKVNKFLEGHSDKIISSGTFVFQDRLTFIWTNDSEEEKSKQMLISAMKNGMTEGLSKLAELDVVIAFARSQALMRVPGKEKEVIGLETDKLNLRKHLRYTKDIIGEIEKGKWPEEVK